MVFFERARTAKDILMMFLPMFCVLMALAVGLCAFSELFIKLNCDAQVLMPFEDASTGTGKKVLMFYEDPCTVYRFCCYAALVFGCMLCPLIHMFQILYSMGQSRQIRPTRGHSRNAPDEVTSARGKMQTVEDMVRELSLTLLPSSKFALLEKTMKKMSRKLTDEEMKEILSGFGDSSTKERAMTIMRKNNDQMGATRRKTRNPTRKSTSKE